MTLVLFIIVVVLVAAFWLGLLIGALCSAAKQGDRRMGISDLSGAAARGELERLREGRQPW